MKKSAFQLETAKHVKHLHHRLGRTKLSLLPPDDGERSERKTFTITKTILSKITSFGCLIKWIFIYCSPHVRDDRQNAESDCVRQAKDDRTRISTLPQSRRHDVSGYRGWSTALIDRIDSLRCWTFAWPQHHHHQRRCFEFLISIRRFFSLLLEQAEFANLDHGWNWRRSTDFSPHLHSLMWVPIGAPVSRWLPMMEDTFCEKN